MKPELNFRRFICLLGLVIFFLCTWTMVMAEDQNLPNGKDKGVWILTDKKPDVEPEKDWDNGLYYNNYVSFSGTTVEGGYSWKDGDDPKDCKGTVWGTFTWDELPGVLQPGAKQQTTIIAEASGSQSCSARHPGACGHLELNGLSLEPHPCIGYNSGYPKPDPETVTVSWEAPWGNIGDTLTLTVNNRVSGSLPAYINYIYSYQAKDQTAENIKCPIGGNAPNLRNPGIASKALCRGACGMNCPSTCRNLPDMKIYLPDSTGNNHFICTYTGVIQCPSHTGCRCHDACFDRCAENGEQDTMGPCHNKCTGDCSLRWEKTNCTLWASGKTIPFVTTPIDSQLNFSDQPVLTGPFPGPGPKAMANDDVPKATFIDRTYVWTGTWESNFGQMVLKQTGNSMTGTYSHDQGRIQGTISGNKVTGTWSESPSYNPPNDAGDFEFTMLDECESKFSGNWRYGSAGSWEEERWSGTRQ